MENTGCIWALLFPNVSPHVRARLSESWVTFEKGVQHSLLVFTLSGCIMSLHVCRKISYFIYFFFFKKSLIFVWHSHYIKSSDVPLYGLAIRNLKVWCVLIMVVDLKMDYGFHFHWNIGTQFVGRNLWRNLMRRLFMWDTTWCQGHKMCYTSLPFIYDFTSQKSFIS